MWRPCFRMNHKLSITLEDGLVVEAVYYPSGTLCISSQAGCAVGCPFCASGLRGLRRNLTLDELHLQLAVARSAGHDPQRLTVSGIGEPLHNPTTVTSLIDEAGRGGLPVSLTTCGGPIGHLQDFLHRPHNGLMLSLHAGQEPIRRQLVPGGPQLDALQRMLIEVWPKLSRRTRRRIGFNYLLFHGINDTAEEMSALRDWLAPFPEATLHLLDPAAGGTPAFRPSPRRDECYLWLCAHHRQVRRGNRWRTSDVGGCGTLFVRSLDALERHGNNGGGTDA